MANATPIKVASGQLSQFAASDTVPVANLQLSATSPVTLSAGGVIAISAATASAAGSESASDFVAIRNVPAMLRGGHYMS